MELRQLRYFVRVVEAGSIGRAAQSIGMVTSALSQQISRLEGELSTRLLRRSASGVEPTDAGLAFFRQAQLALRHADDAVHAAQQARLAGHVSVGLPSTTAAILGAPFVQAMNERYPDIRLHLVEALSGHLSDMLNGRMLDLAIVFQAESARRLRVTPLLDEPLFLLARPDMAGLPAGESTRIEAIAHLPLVLPSGRHGLRALVNNAYQQSGRTPLVAVEVDGLPVLMDVVQLGHVATIQPSSAMARIAPGQLHMARIDDAHLYRPNLLASLSEDELSPAALAARLVLADVSRRLAREGKWPVVALHDS
ncbi:MULTISPECIES: LysR family transcriptional regulator [Achromobacter]|uniref:LysR family transcriptional regulator n=2 Tax=Achromobacter TaxID=222 RepID=A0A424WKR5_ALCXX|nr:MULTISPECIES: LysR family transcriptional regulator [Achromobacter]MBC9903206.1 LysR family transcriptional regulator [Achromobacter xylosoxidans]MBD0867796.1 LysR family transcriptional regulator [Achromobacter xylosoxidans]QNP86731.1 LysR family transcriptional regulator [Achromobacter xylosoxidans]RPJ93866.1 LysR family transcriptional regulator [Achromobacter xylosoxidans]WLW62655.1 LysR family transcriptional regulator [Achromobacter aegrifaciens]